MNNSNFNENNVKEINISNKSKLHLLLNQHLNSLPTQVLPFYNSSVVLISKKNISTLENQDLNGMLLEGYEFDHLKLFNSNFLISLTTSKSSNALNVHNLSKYSTNLSTSREALKFNS